MPIKFMIMNKKIGAVCCVFTAIYLLLLPSTIVAQDTAVVAKPYLSPAMQLYLMNPNSTLFLESKSVTLDFELDPLLASAQYDDNLSIRQRMAVDNMGQSISMGLQKEQRNMQVLGILNMVATGFVWGMIIKENIEGYYDYKSQQREQQQLQQQQKPPRPPEVRKPTKQ